MESGKLGEMKKLGELKVLQFCMSTGVGGLELYAVRTAKQLRQNGISVIAIVRGGSMLSQRMQQEGIETIQLNPAGRFFPLLRARSLARLLELHEINIMHMHDGKDLSLAVLAKLFCRHPVKLIYTRQMILTRAKKDFYHRFFYRHVDLFVTITKQLLQQAQEYLPMPKQSIRHLYYGVMKPPQLSELQRQELRQEFGVPADTIAVGLVGRVEANKGQHLLIDAVHKLKQQGVAVHATLIGPSMGSDYENRIKKRVQDLQLQERVNFYGSHNNPIEIMGIFDVIVLATDMETFGLVLIEAMRNKVAVIGSRAGGVPEIIEDGESGLMFKPKDAEDLAQKLKLLAENHQLREKLAAAGYDRAELLFTQERHFGTLLKLYSETAGIKFSGE